MTSCRVVTVLEMAVTFFQLTLIEVADRAEGRIVSNTTTSGSTTHNTIRDMIEAGVKNLNGTR